MSKKKETYVTKPEKYIAQVSYLMRNVLSEPLHFREVSPFSRKFINTGSNSFAVNRHDSTSQQVKVSHLFDAFWYYIEISFKQSTLNKRERWIPFISVSFFEGEEYDNNKKQLFRAEWDNYTYLTESDETFHPQPHWHITYIPKEYIDISTENPVAIIDEKNNLDIHKMHFAMCENWLQEVVENEDYLTPQQLASWLLSLFSHVTSELKYITKKKREI